MADDKLTGGLDPQTLSEIQAETNREGQALDDVVEACADALLTACGATLVWQHGEPPNVDDVMIRACVALDRIVERTKREGARPR